MIAKSRIDVARIHPMNTATIRDRLTAHLASKDGTPNDNTTDALYREAHGLAEDVETDLETVEQWAFATVRPVRHGNKS